MVLGKRGRKENEEGKKEEEKEEEEENENKEEESGWNGNWSGARAAPKKGVPTYRGNRSWGGSGAAGGSVEAGRKSPRAGGRRLQFEPTAGKIALVAKTTGTGVID